MGTRTTQLAPEIERLVERRLRNWEISREQQQTASLTATEVHEFVCISRQVGAGGGEIAKHLSEQLGWPVFGREILQVMAGSDVARERLYRGVDECSPGLLDQMLDMFVNGRFPLDDYTHHLSKTILALARTGPSIFLGRAADLILPAEHGLRVRVVAPLDYRARRHGERSYMDEAWSREEVIRIDRERAAFINHYFNRDINEPARCALTISTAQISISEAVEMIVSLLRKRGMTS